MKEINVKIAFKDNRSFSIEDIAKYTLEYIFKLEKDTTIIIGNSLFYDK